MIGRNIPTDPDLTILALVVLTLPFISCNAISQQKVLGNIVIIKKKKKHFSSFLYL